jgi:glycosyltransferase involved in cell wall biosynthesis
VTTLRPLVSVCISAYNVELYLAESIRSVLAQTYDNLEIIVLDNGSADGTFGVAQSFTDPRVRSLRVAENMGAYQAMNYLVTMTTGKYVAVYHSDDVYEPTIVERELARLTAHPDVGAVFTMLSFMDESGRIFGGANLPPMLAGKDTFTYQDVIRALLWRKCTFLPCPTFMVRREVFDAVGPFRPERYGIGTDLEMWLRLVRRYPIAIIDERLIRYRRGPHQWSSRYLDGRTEREAYFQVMDEYLDMDGWRAKLAPVDLVEHRFHDIDDATFRAANMVRKGDPAGALALLRANPFPWRTLLAAGRRRKTRNLVLRTMIRGGIALRAVQPLAFVLGRIGP